MEGANEIARSSEGKIRLRRKSDFLNCDSVRVFGGLAHTHRPAEIFYETSGRLDICLGRHRESCQNDDLRGPKQKLVMPEPETEALVSPHQSPAVKIWAIIYLDFSDIHDHSTTRSK